MDNSLNQIIENSLNEIYVVDVDTLKFLYANETALEHIEYSLQELKQMSPFDLRPKELHDDIHTHIQNLSKENPHLNYKSSHLKKSGTAYPVDINLQLSQYNGKPAYVVFAFDCSKKYITQDQLLSSTKIGPYGYSDWNFQTGEYLVNDHWLDILGMNRSDFNNTIVERDNLFHPDDLALINQSIENSILSNYPNVHEFRMKHKAGHWVCIQISGAIVERDSVTGKPIRLTATYKDISKQKRDEIERKQFNTFFNISPDIMVITNSNNEFVKINSAITKILGYSEKDILFKPVINFTHPEDQKFTEAQFISIRNTLTIVKAETRIRCKDGTYRWLSWNARYDDNTGLTYATARDITDHKVLIEKMYKEEQMYRALAEASHDVIMQYDRQHRHTFANSSAEKLVGLAASKFIGKTHKEIGFPDNLCDLWEKSIETAFLTGKPNNLFFEADNPVGRMNIDWRVFPETNSSGEVLSVVSIARDITQTKKTEAEEQQLQKLNSLGILAGGIAHDFNNILTILFGNITLAKENLSESHSSIVLLEKAEKAYQRATHLTSQLLTFAKGGDPVKENVNIIQLIEEIVKFDLSGSNVKLVFTADAELWIANVDMGQITQVFSNLTINANQAMPDGGHLYINICNTEITKGAIKGLAPGKYLKFTVRDEGYGINPETLNKIFDPYFSTKENGHGLGLATVHSVINKHNGHIYAESQLGKGTSFTLYLPAPQAAFQSTSSPNKSIRKIMKTNKKVLILDDEEMIRTLAAQSLKSKGYIVSEANDGQQAIELYKQSLEENDPFDCVIMDLTIPGGIGGAEAIKEILTQDPNAKAIVSSGYAVDPIMANYADYGFKDVIAKPFTISGLRDVVHKVISEP